MSSRRPRPSRSLIAACSSAGFTAVETMVVVAIVAILAALALPNFRILVQRYRVRTASEALSSALYFARTEAIRHGGRVSLARRVADTGCTSRDNSDWHCGWHVFSDDNENGRFDAGQGDTVLHTFPAHAGLVIKIRGRNTIVFNRWGGFNGAGIAGFGLRPEGNPDPRTARALCVSSGGRIRAVAGAFKCS